MFGLLMSILVNVEPIEDSLLSMSGSVLAYIDLNQKVLTCRNGLLFTFYLLSLWFPY